MLSFIKFPRRSFGISMDYFAKRKKFWFINSTPLPVLIAVSAVRRKQVSSIQNLSRKCGLVH